ncbi:MAG: hypothetical protein Q9174_000303 [Haloplaca sp. 1 TL-2023]
MNRSIRAPVLSNCQTEWSKNGRYTGTTELELTPEGRQQVRGTTDIVVGPGKLIDPSKMGHVFVSPRKRAHQTFDILLGETFSQRLTNDNRVTTTEDLAEWNYGAYEGLVTGEIRERRLEQGLDAEHSWDIWKDGCEDGE